MASIDSARGPVEAFVPDALDLAAAIVCAAHPADDFGAATAGLLAAAAGAQVVCVSPRAGRPLADMVDDIDAVRARLGIDRWVFWGMSGGGWLGELYAQRHPDALAGVVLESVCACFRARLADPACILSPYHPAWRGTLAAAGLVDPEAHASARPADDGVWEDVPGIGTVFRRPGGPALLVSPAPVSPAMRRAMPELWRVDARAWLPSLRVAALVVAGTADPVVPLAHARAVHEAIPGSRFVAIDGAGHVPTAEGRPEVAAAVRSFLAG
jgi:pimeloyl-ACP methyl ester carboxylesterase